MRIDRLDLERYGRFTDQRIVLSRAQPDLHIVFGANEAGKSTTLSALEDLLFGIPLKSPHNFLHDYGAMRIGAVLSNASGSLELQRRKGAKDTLLGADGTPLPTGEGALAAFLHGADRAFFVRMFSLDHARLRQGGRDILEARDAVGQMLFSAGAGIGGLRARLKALEDEADGLWGAKRAKHRRYTQAEDRLHSADAELREVRLTAVDWQRLKTEVEAAEAAHGAVEQDIAGLVAEQRKLGRIRRIYRFVRDKQALDAEIAAAGSPPVLPVDARIVCGEARQDIANASHLIEVHGTQQAAARAERAAVAVDKEVLRRAADIEAVRERRIQVAGERRDLPKRRAELAEAEAELRRLGDELGWPESDPDTLIGRIPSRAAIAELRRLITRHGALSSRLDIARAALADAERKRGECADALAECGAGCDVGRLAALVRATRASGDGSALVATAEDAVRVADEAVRRRLEMLEPTVADEAMLAAMALPARETVIEQRQAGRELAARRSANAEALLQAEAELARRRDVRQRLAAAADPVTDADVTRARRERDERWALLKRKYIDGESLPKAASAQLFADGPDPGVIYQQAVRRADAAADRRLQTAEAAGRLAEIDHSIVEQSEACDGLRREAEAIGQAATELEARWRALWEGSGVAPRDPEAMLEWLAGRREILDLLEQRDAAAAAAAGHGRRVGTSRAALLAELALLGAELDGLEQQSLETVLEYAADLQLRHERLAETRQRGETALRAAAAEADTRRAQAEAAEADWAGWRELWDTACAAAGFGRGTSPEAMAALIEAVDRMREVAHRIVDLRDNRIAKIERDVADFAAQVGELIDVLAPDAAGLDPGDAVLELESRLAEAGRARDQAAAIDRRIKDLDARIAEAEAARRAAGDRIHHLMELAGTEEVEELVAAIAESDRLRDLTGRRQAAIAAIEEEGDGLPLAELEEECRDVDPDAAAAREAALEASVDELRERQAAARERLAAARREFEAIGGDDRAAVAAADREAALAEMTEIAERYLQVKTSALLLHWAIDRYRRDKQAPLLARAGELFAVLTGGGFAGLRLRFDGDDQARLAGLRPEGEEVGIEGMSTGTADQLYLALRVAAIEDYLDRAAPLPFVADDLFVNFDDARTAAGLTVLSELARKCQVIVFTHHRHLVEIARDSLGPDLSVVELAGAEAGD